MFTVLVTLIIILCILLSLVVLAQAAKGNGLAGGLGAPGSVGTMFGVRRASDFLMKATIIIAAVFMLFSIAVNRLFLPTTTGQIVNPLREGPAPVQSMPGGGQPQTVPPGAQSAPVQAPAPAPAAPAN
jgi:preprotein translocase subunit SecG